MTKEIPQGFIDIHSHILPGLDDGPESMDQCITAAKMYSSLGVSCVIATPHWIRSTGWSHIPEKIIDRIKTVEKHLADAEIELTILPGMEISYSAELEEDFLSSHLLPLGTSQYYLIEFPLTSPPGKTADDFLLQSAVECRRPFIIAHPERCELFQRDGRKLQQLVENGMLCQLNIDSLLGGFGSTVQKSGLDFVQQGLVHFLASDSHAGQRRMVPDIAQWKMIEKLLGKDTVTLACSDNPRKMLAGQDITALRVHSDTIKQYLTEQFSEKKCKKSSLPIKTNKLAQLAGTLKKKIERIKK